MSKSELNNKEVALLNSKLGLHALLKNKKVDLVKSLEEVEYYLELQKRQEELIKLQAWAIENDEKIVILCEGRDSAGKGGAIRRFTQYINPRHYRIVALNIPTDDERKQWFFQRYIYQLPKPGEIVFFDRSWYNRAVVEPVNNFCTESEYEIFMSQVNDFEKMVIQSGIHLIKLYFSISKEEQAKRFKDIKKDPLKRWKMTAVDERAQELWDEYSTFKEQMFEKTNTVHAPWTIISADKKSSARLNAISHVLETIPYK
ncbi:polyphosphate kinase 2 [Kriegella aquimaris]|uniref:ADP/GDP-polyphosphate phosphotransferase n=1 Tax=Kriegella aquimaris TaxID=192904 RepID=A0A1G9SXB2_9FLAO|nr:polyphosphate kinase 2 [Kriegella aquimaris]SDM40108.1 polyphosphate kinase 2, PA0141 family [Kriegella aquimaris]